MNKRHQFRDGEKHLSQIPALHLLQTMAPKWVMLSKAEVDRERRGKLSNVLLDDILRAQLMRLNAIEYRGKQYPFSESNIQTAIERLRSREPLGIMRLNEFPQHLVVGTKAKRPGIAAGPFLFEPALNGWLGSPCHPMPPPPGVAPLSGGNRDDRIAGSGNVWQLYVCRSRAS
jgi:hypothetical protein